MYQSLHRDRSIKAWCCICSGDTQKFEEANSTTNTGLSIEMHDGESQHFGAPVFKRAEYALHELDRLVHRHPDSDELARLLRQIRARHSEREMDGVSLMLTEASQEKLPCMQAVTWQPGRTW